jgi:hypothetical protein
MCATSRHEFEPTFSFVRTLVHRRRHLPSGPPLSWAPFLSYPLTQPLPCRPQDLDSSRPCFRARVHEWGARWRKPKSLAPLTESDAVAPQGAFYAPPPFTHRKPFAGRGKVCDPSLCPAHYCTLMLPLFGPPFAPCPHLCTNGVRARVTQGPLLRPAPAQPPPFAGAQEGTVTPPCDPAPIARQCPPPFLCPAPHLLNGVRAGVTQGHPPPPPPLRLPCPVCGGAGRYVPPPFPLRP